MPNAEKSISLENVTDVGAGLTSKEISDRIAQGKVNGDFNIPNASASGSATAATVIPASTSFPNFPAL